jgi:malate dehydrogenase (oxaloacetate-decarboxylating)(NADP+)
VSGFPYIFRGALDVEATEINDEMKIAAARALAALAKEPVTDDILKAYNTDSISFGIDYVIPKPLDARILTSVTPAVAQAAMDSGVARRPITDMAAYAKSLEARISASHGRIVPFIESYQK